VYESIPASIFVFDVSETVVNKIVSEKEHR
jgi:hypothetical protein